MKRAFSIGGLLGGLFVVLLLTSCKGKKETTAAFVDRKEIPVLDTREVSMLISDSGVTRYRINTPHWQIYDKAVPSYWEFKEGVYLEEFNEDLSIEASLKADYAKYLDQQELWELDGNVHVQNEEGEEFDTQQLFWDQRREQVYSDSLITIHRASSTIMGIGFESNQTMTQYTILQPTGFFPVEEIEE